MNTITMTTISQAIQSRVQVLARLLGVLRVVAVSALVIAIAHQPFATAQQSKDLQNKDSQSKELQNKVPTPTSPDSSKTPKWRLGIFGGPNVNLHAAQFPNIPGVPYGFWRLGFATNSDTTFTTPLVNLGFAAGILYEIPVDPLFRLGVRASYATHDVSFQNTQIINVPDQNFNAVERRFVSSITSRINSVALEPTIVFNPFGGFHIQAGGRIGYVLTKEFSQGTDIPEGLALPNGSRRFLEQTGNLPTTLLISALGGIGYDISIPLGETVGSLIVAPEASFLFGLNPVVGGFDKGGSWNLNQVRAGLALKYESPDVRTVFEYQDVIDTIQVSRPLATLDPAFSTGSPEYLRDTLFAPATRTIRESRRRTDTLITPAPAIAGGAQAFGVYTGNVEKPLFLVRIEEFLANRYLPLLNYVFFDENSAELPERYTRLTPEQVEKFTVESLYNYEPLRAYQQILNIVGRRMHKYPNAKITLTGCNCFFGTEKGSLPLSLRRAQAAREYLLTAWGIDSSRISIKARNLSEKPSIPITEDDKIIENRRTEITSDTPEILEWIATPDTLRRIEPPLVRFKLNAKADKGIQRWRLTVEQDGVLVRNFGGNGRPPVAVDWDVAREERERGERLIRNEKPLEYTLTLTDSTGQRYTTDVASLPVELLTIQKKRRELRKDKEFEQLSLILFGFDRAELSDLHKRTAAFVKTRIKPSSEVEIVGYTDRTGAEDYNRKLGERRATQISALVKHPKTKVRGIGKDELLYDNDLPEGRFYCRTVTVVIETPIETQ